MRQGNLSSLLTHALLKNSACRARPASQEQANSEEKAARAESMGSPWPVVRAHHQERVVPGAAKRAGASSDAYQRVVSARGALSARDALLPFRPGAGQKQVAATRCHVATCHVSCFEIRTPPSKYRPPSFQIQTLFLPDPVCAAFSPSPAPNTIRRRRELARNRYRPPKELK